VDHQPCIFISWSGEKGRKVAESLRSWLPYIFDRLQFWFSPKDLPEGAWWSAELSRCLDASHFGILIITPESLGSPWIMFETGALSKNLFPERRVVPYLIALKESDLIGPIAQLQALQADEIGTLRLVMAINNVLDFRQDTGVIERRFAKFWTDFKETVEAVRVEYEGRQEVKQAQPVFALDYETLQKQLGKFAEDNRSLQKQIVTLTNLVQQMVEQSPVTAALKVLEGAWVNTTCKTHIYIALVDGRLVAPYCYRGNDKLTAECYEWKRWGEFLFARFRWLVREEINGFAFFTLISNDILEGAWWSSSGAVKLRWERTFEKFPAWALEYIEKQTGQSLLEAGSGN
jgi:TIR domain